MRVGYFDLFPLEGLLDVFGQRVSEVEVVLARRPDRELDVHRGLPEALEDEDRTGLAKGGDSGWYMGRADAKGKPSAEELAGFMSCGLVRLGRERLLDVLALPVGYIARFDGESLLSASDSLSITGSFVAIEEATHKVTQRDLTEIDTSEAASVTTLVVPSFSKPVEPEPIEVEESEDAPTDRLDAAQVAGFDDIPTTRLELPAIESEPEPSTPETPQAPITQTFSSKKEKKSFSPILIFALVALALLAATFLFYKFYYQPRHQPPAQQPDEIQQSQPQPSNAEQPPTNQSETATPAAEPTPEGGRPQKHVSPNSTSEK